MRPLPRRATASAYNTSFSNKTTSKGQVPIPKALRQQLGLSRGSRVSDELVGKYDYAADSTRRMPGSPREPDINVHTDTELPAKANQAGQP
jgi:hypothetical protein